MPLSPPTPTQPTRSPMRSLARLVGRRSRVLLGVAALAAGSGAGLVTAAALPGPANAATGFGGTASAQLVHLDALDVPPTIDLANASVAPATAAVDSTGGLSGGAQSQAKATNLDVNLLNNAIPLDNLLVSASQTAPPDHASPTTNQLLSLPANPLLDATVARATAQARAIPAGGCPAVGQPIATSSSELADASVINGALGSSGSALVALDNSQGATVNATGSVELHTVPGQATDGVVSTATTQLTAVTLFRGTPQELTINVVAPPTITAIATGRAGGASVSYSEPILQIVQGGKVIGTLDSKNLDFTLPLGLGSLSLGTLTGVTQSADGTQAAGNAVLLNLAIGGPGTPLPSLVNLSIAPLSASATVPTGGVACPGPGPSTNPLAEVHKDLSAAVAYPSTPFQYVVAVPNRGTCTLQNVVATDTVTGPAGSTISATSPTATVSGLQATWTVGTLAPNQTDDLLLTVTPPASLTAGESYSNQVTVTGTCNGTPVSQTATISGPSAAGGPTPVGSTCSVQGSNKAASHLQVVDGESFDYYVHVFDTSAQPCTAVVVTDTLGPNVTFVSCTGGCTHSGSTVTWNVGTLAPGQSVDLTATVTASDSAPAGTTLPNTATITPSNGSPVAVSTPGPTVTGTSVLAPPSPATLPGTAPGTLGGGGGSGSTTGTGTGTGTATGGPGGSGVAVSPSVAGASGAASPTSVHTGLWFAGSTPVLVGMVTFGLVLLGWPRLRQALAAHTG